MNRRERIVYEIIREYNAEWMDSIMTDSVLNQMRRAGYNWQCATVLHTLDRLVRSGQVSVHYHPTPGMGEFYHVR